MKENVRKDHLPDTRGASGKWRERRVVNKADSLRWLERLRVSQKKTSYEEKRKEQILDTFRELCRISHERYEIPSFPPWESPW